MDNIVFERNYEETEEDTSYCTAIFDQAVSGGFFERYGEMMDNIPKMIAVSYTHLTLPTNSLV